MAAISATPAAAAETLTCLGTIASTKRGSRYGEVCGRALPCPNHSIKEGRIGAEHVAAFLERQIWLRDDVDEGGRPSGGRARLAAELAASGQFTEDGAVRMIHMVLSGVQLSVGNDRLDRVLAALDLTDLWRTHDPFAEAAAREAHEEHVEVQPIPVGIHCEDCGTGPLVGDELRPLDLMRPDPSASRWVWNATAQKLVYRPQNARPGGRRFRIVNLCRLCAAEVLRQRAAKNPKFMENGVRRVMRTRERIPPKRGGRPRLLTDTQLRSAHVLYVRGELSMSDVARKLHEAGQKGTVDGLSSALYYGWKRLKLPTRSRSESMTLVHRDVLGNEIGRRAAQIANKRRCSGRRIVAGREGGKACRQWAIRGSDFCAMHERYGQTPRSELKPRCSSLTQKGRPCSFHALDGSEKCRIHGSPVYARAMVARMIRASRSGCFR